MEKTTHILKIIITPRKNRCNYDDAKAEDFSFTHASHLAQNLSSVSLACLGYSVQAFGVVSNKQYFVNLIWVVRPTVSTISEE